MHLLERYATSCGVKISKPYIYENFFPLPTERYISFQPFSKYPSKNYDYWDEVIAMIHPYLLKENIKIIQIGAKQDRPVVNTYNLCGQTTIQQAAFIIKHGIMHVGADSFAAHIASGYDKKIVALYSNNNINNVKPYWSKKEDIILLNPEINKKPQYSVDEFPKSINKIKPEIIANSILNLLNIETKKLPNTIFIGEDYANKTLQIIPDNPVDPRQFNIENLIIRMDYAFNEKALEVYLQHKKCIIFTNKPISLELLQRYKNNIPQVVYIIEKENDFNFIRGLKNISINYAMMSWLDENELNNFKLNYMDLGLIVNKKINNQQIDIKNNVFFKSSIILISSEGQFNSKYQWLTKDISNKYNNNLELMKELNNLYIFSLDQE
jgi:hypothetical protein